MQRRADPLLPERGPDHAHTDARNSQRSAAHCGWCGGCSAGRQRFWRSTRSGVVGYFRRAPWHPGRVRRGRSRHQYFKDRNTAGLCEPACDQGLGHRRGRGDFFSRSALHRKSDRHDRIWLPRPRAGFIAARGQLPNLRIRSGRGLRANRRQPSLGGWVCELGPVGDYGNGRRTSPRISKAR